MSVKRQESNFFNPETNPCVEEALLSRKCLERNNYNKDDCVAYFANYQVCKKFWGKVYVLRRRNGITPFLPLPDEREKIVNEFRSSKNFIYAAE